MRNDDLIIETCSVLLLTTCGAAVVCGPYAVRSSITRLNRLSLTICATLTVWAFGLALTDAARTEEICSVGRRIAPLGQEIIDSLTMHVVLPLTGRERLLGKRWLLFLVYLPAAMSIYTYTIPPLFDRSPGTLVHTGHDQVNILETDGWDWFYYTYIVLYAAVAVVLLLRWGRHSTPNGEKKQVKIISSSFFFTAVLGYITDTPPAFFHIRFPRVAAIFTLVMIFTVGYYINRCHFLQPVAINQNEMILSRSAHTNVYLYLGLMLFVSAYLLLTDRFFYTGHQNAIPVQVVSGLLMLLGTFLASTEHLRLEDNMREMLVSLSFALIIPFYTLWFANEGILIAWSFVFLPMIICLLFSRLIILSTMIVTAFLTQLFAWDYTPPEVIVLSGKYYLDRMGVVVFAAIFAMYVSKIYTTRLQENINHAAVQSTTSGISHSFVSLDEMNTDQRLYMALRECGRFIECDRACLVLMNVQTNTVRYAVEWMSETVDLPRSTLGGAAQNIRSEIPRRFQGDKTLVLKGTLFLPTEAAEVRAQSLAQGIRVLAAVPIRDKGELMGFVGSHAGRPFSVWSLDSTAFVGVVGLIPSNAVIKADDKEGLNYLAFHGQLIGLPNRILFKKRLGERTPHTKGDRKMIGIVFLDLDAFKSVNDVLGRGQGDWLLIEIAKALDSSTRDGDTVACFGRDEFILMFSQITLQEELTAITDRLMKVVQKPILLAEQEFFISVSADVAVYPQGGDDPEMFLKNADTAMYRVRSGGRGRYVFYSQEIEDKIRAKIQLVNQLYHALEKDQLLLHYRPQIDVTTRRIMGMEALARRNLPGRGIVSPTKSIPLAEQTELIHAIGEWVMREAYRQNQLWLRMGCTNLRMTINVSVQQLRNPEFIPLIKEILQTMESPPNCLELGVTENVVNGNTDRIIMVLHRLKALGVSISIGGFGTEYSFLSRPKLPPADRIKVDIQFVHDVERNNKNRAVSKVIINLAKNLEMRVAAERVETEPQLDFLSQRMCNEMQDFYCYRPMPADEAEALLRETLCTQKENIYNTELQKQSPEKPAVTMEFSRDWFFDFREKVSSVMPCR